MGSKFWSALAKTAANTITSKTTPPAAPSGFFLTKRRTVVPMAGRAGRPAATATSIAIAYRWVEHPVEQIHGEVRQHHHDGDEHHQVLDDRVVAPEDRLDQETRHPGQIEDGLGDHEAAEQERQLDADHGDDGQHRVLEGVPPDDDTLGLPLGPGGADIVLAQHLEHR